MPGKKETLFVRFLGNMKYVPEWRSPEQCLRVHCRWDLGYTVSIYNQFSLHCKVVTSLRNSWMVVLISSRTYAM